MCASVQTCVRDVRGWSEVYDSVWAELTEQLLTISKERKEIKINCLFSVFLSIPCRDVPTLVGGGGWY